MRWLCPICNGMNEIIDRCPSCGYLAEDVGKASDFWAPYSPYREIDDLKMTNGYVDAATHRCIHMMHCMNCQLNYVYAVAEVSDPSKMS